MIDLRSDTVTQPTEPMRQFLAKAEVGDEVYSEDPTVKLLEERMMALTGKSAAIFAPSGTQSNLIGLMAHCERGDEYIAGQQAHLYKYEAGGAAVLASIQPQPIEFEKDATLCFEKIKAHIKPDDMHFARTKLLCLENTHSGQPLPIEYLRKARVFCDEHNLKLHLDGARVFNAAIKTKESVKSICEPFDSVSICFSKGLGAPVGSMLLGEPSLIEKAHRYRKILGGGMRQAGLLAAACLYALDHHVERLADDHENAKELMLALREYPQLNVLDKSAMTNMVFVDVPDASLDQLHKEAERLGVVLPSGNKLRLVTHINISKDDIRTVIELFDNVYGA